MKVYVDIKDKHYVVLGLARSGVGACNLLLSLGAKVTVMDKKEKRELDKFIAKLNPAAKIYSGGFDDNIINKADVVVVSPGVALTNPSIVKAKQNGVRIIGEFELAYQIVQKTRKKSAASFLAITGTNGKSTTTTMVYEILKTSGLNAMIGGNIGLALTEEVHKMLDKCSDEDPDATIPDFIVTEVSSFQLESIETFKPKGAAILNITPDHLDRHASMDEYINAKCRIFEKQDALDFLVLNADDPVTAELARKKIPAQKGVEIVYFSRKNKVKGAFINNNVICFNLPEHEILCPELILSELPILKVDDFKVKGVHNVENAMAASLMALLSGVSVENIRNTLLNFIGIEHRMEFVAEINGVKYVNDSKGTNVSAVEKSLESFSVPLILIAGGTDKGLDFTALRPYIKGRVKALVLIGAAKDKIKAAIGDLTDTVIAQTMEEAVVKSSEIAESGDVVLLSPACASFDMFKDFEHRGRVFKKAVHNLTKQQL
ncbi:UDP-N-acetylmuramoylalanine--D-glutamate ligase [Candidatus Magnetoovum chiemensis]|nr:UDP-N-acetylmuramoylalanine--D-glutamate ligase [Candidatus Magnetoovum chiemensis]